MATPASTTPRREAVCVFLPPDRDRGAEMLYHDHPVLIKPYQICVSEQKSREAAACKCMFYCQRGFFFFNASFLMDLFE